MVDRIGTGGNIFSPRINPYIQQSLAREMFETDTMDGVQDKGPQEPAINQRSIDVAEFAGELRETFGELSRSAGEITPPDSPIDTSVFQQRSIEVENPDILEARLEPGAARQELRVNVEELSREQIEQTAVFEEEESAHETLDIEGEEEFVFAIEQGEVRETFQVEVDEEDTMRDILERTAEEIQAREGVNVEAVVVDEDEGLDEGEVGLEIRGLETGEDRDFVVEDVEGDLIESLEIERTQEAADAGVEIDNLVEDEGYEVREDTVILDEGRIELDLREEGETIVDIASDTEEIRQGVEDFVDAYDMTLEFLRGRETNDDLARIEERLTRATFDNRRELEEVGIEVDEEGILAVRDEVLEEVAEEDPESLEETLAPLSAQVERIAEETLRTPPSRFMEETDREELDVWEELEEFQLFDQSGRGFAPLAMQPGMLFDFFM